MWTGLNWIRIQFNTRYTDTILVGKSLGRGHMDDLGIDGMISERTANK
jgi:hypothetical protein